MTSASLLSPSAVSSRPTVSSPQEAKVAFLSDPVSYPHATRQVDLIETHMSWVFLTDDYVYKLKKPIQYNRLDLTTPSARRRNSVLEVQLNRRLAGTVYRGVVRLAERNGVFSIGGTGPAADWLVKMERLPAERMLDVLAERGAMRSTDVDATVKRLSRLYETLPPAVSSPRAYQERLSHSIRTNAHALRTSPYRMPPAQVDAVTEALLWYVKHAQATLEARVLDGRVVEGHGDLRPEHVCLSPEPVIFDCLEFSRDLRVLDALDEVAFLAMECERLGASFATSAVVDAYQRHMREDVPLHLVRFYQGFRALQRARIAIQKTWPPRETSRPAQHGHSQAEAYLNVAEKILNLI